MIDFRKEKVFPLKEAPKKIGTNPHLCTVHRWAGRGIRGIPLETVKMGGIRCTSAEALQRFFAATTAASARDHGRAVPHDTGDNAREAAELDGLGL
jgi:hypothetical protein